jgi:hypothetical protein
MKILKIGLFIIIAILIIVGKLIMMNKAGIIPKAF